MACDGGQQGGMSLCLALGLERNQRSEWSKGAWELGLMGSVGSSGKKYSRRPKGWESGLLGSVSSSGREIRSHDWSRKQWTPRLSFNFCHCWWDCGCISFLQRERLTHRMAQAKHLTILYSWVRSWPRSRLWRQAWPICADASSGNICLSLPAEQKGE